MVVADRRRRFVDQLSAVTAQPTAKVDVLVGADEPVVEADRTDMLDVDQQVAARQEVGVDDLRGAEVLSQVNGFPSLGQRAPAQLELSTAGDGCTLHHQGVA